MDIEFVTTGGADMHFEAEVLYFYIGGTALVVLSELLIAVFSRKQSPRRSRALLWHTLFTAAAFACLGIVMTGGGGAHTPGEPYGGSVIFGLFGIFWAISEACVVNGIMNTSDKTDE